MNGMSITVLILLGFTQTAVPFPGKDAAVPLEFPESTGNFTFVDNPTIRESLINRTENSELEDLKMKTIDLDEVLTTLKTNLTSEIEEVGRKGAFEWIENGDDTEDNKFRPETVINEVIVVQEEVKASTQSEKDYKDGVPLIDGSMAAILVCSFLVLSVLGYVILILWRRALEARYGSREMLVDVDEMFDPNDIKHFSI